MEALWKPDCWYILPVSPLFKIEPLIQNMHELDLFYFIVLL